MAPSSAKDGAAKRKTCGWGVIRAGKGITIVIWNEHINIARIIKSLENLGVLIDGVSETVKHEIKKQVSGILGMLLRTLGASMLGNITTVKLIMKDEKVL